MPLAPVPAVSVCVCTFRRPHVERTVRSVNAAIRHAGVPAEIVVVDNDERATGREAVRRAAARTDVPVRYHHSPGGNISVARNASLDAARGRLVAFVDDDERVDEIWLAALLARREETGADAVFGPVRALYGPGVPAWMRRLAPHGTAPVRVGGEIRTGYTCNVVLDRTAPAFRGRRFDPARGRTGGEDTAFFDAAWRAGATFAEAPDAWVEEDVPEMRAKLRWLLERRFRSGQTRAALLMEGADRTGSRARFVGPALAKLAFCAANALLAAPVPTWRNGWLLRGALHAGVVAGLHGVRERELYGPTATRGGAA